VAHTWEPPPPEPPWVVTAAPKSLGVFAAMLILPPLFLFRANRCGAAWWIWLPVLISLPAGMAIVYLLSDGEWHPAQAIGAFVIGQAAMWLLMPYLQSRYRIASFLKALPVLAGFGLLAFVPALFTGYSGWFDFRLYLAVVLALASLATTFALSMGGFSVRRRFGRVRFLISLAVWNALAWLVIASPLFIMGIVSGRSEWGPALIFILGATGSSLALLLPLLLLSFFQPFYRARLLGFLNVPEIGSPSGATVPPRLPSLHQPEGSPADAVTAK
jgi:hypothetical protein